MIKLWMILKLAGMPVLVTGPLPFNYTACANQGDAVVNRIKQQEPVSAQEMTFECRYSRDTPKLEVDNGRLLDQGGK